MGRNRDDQNEIIDEQEISFNVMGELTMTLENLGCFKRVSPTSALIESI